MVPLVLMLLVIGAAPVHARPIEVEVGRGRNWNAVKLVDQAQEQFLKGDLAGARRSVDAAIQADPSYLPALYIRAQIFIEQHHYEAAGHGYGRKSYQHSSGG